jgi:hypothetical protein
MTISGFGAKRKGRMPPVSEIAEIESFAPSATYSFALASVRPGFQQKKSGAHVAPVAARPSLCLIRRHPRAVRGET